MNTPLLRSRELLSFRLVNDEVRALLGEVGCIHGPVGLDPLGDAISRIAKARQTYQQGEAIAAVTG